VPLDEAWPELPAMKAPRLFHKSHCSIAIASTCIVAEVSFGFTTTLGAQAGAQPTSSKTFDFSSDPDFKNYLEVLSQFAKKHRPKAEKQFLHHWLS